MASTSEVADLLDDNEMKLSDIFASAMKLYQDIDKSKEPTNSPNTQQNIQKNMRQFENATLLVSHGAVFSANESVEELSTDSLQYLLLPALLGTLSLKITSQPRRDIVNVAEIYFRDFLQRCKDYGITDVTIPQPNDNEDNNQVQIKSNQNEREQFIAMVRNRDEKLKQYNQQKALKNELKILKIAMESPNIDEGTKREYFISLIKYHVHQALEELSSIDAEKTLLDFKEQLKSTSIEEEEKKPKRPPAPLKPFIITKDNIQKTVYGLGYPSLPVLTVEEFYEQRVQEGSFPGPQTKKGITSLQETTEADMEHVKNNEDAEKERKEEDDEPEQLQRARNMDEYKDTHKRGWGNRHNRS